MGIVPAGVLTETYSCDRGGVEEADLPSLSAYDRSTLMLTMTWQDEGPNWRLYVGVSCTARQDAYVIVDTADGSIPAAALQDEIAAFIVANGSPIVQWHRLLFLLPILAWAALVASYMWLAFTVELPAAAHGLVLVIIAFAAIGTVGLVRTARAWASKRPSVIRFRKESRKDTYARRADAHSNLKVVAITTPITVVATLLVAWLSGVLNL